MEVPAPATLSYLGHIIWSSGMRLKWFIIGAMAASLVWLIVISGLGLQWVYALSGR